MGLFNTGGVVDVSLVSIISNFSVIQSLSNIIVDVTNLNEYRLRLDHVAYRGHPSKA